MVVGSCCGCSSAIWTTGLKDIPLTVLAGHRSTPRAPAFATMQPRAVTAAAAEPAPGDLLQLDAAAAADAVRSRAIAGAVGSGTHSTGLINLQLQLGRAELRGSAAGVDVVSAADADAAAWIGFYTDPRRPDVQKPRLPGAVGFERQLSRAAVGANAAAAAAPEVGKETGDVDGGVYQPRLAAVWPAAAAAGFTSAARPGPAAAAQGAGVVEHAADAAKKAATAAAGASGDGTTGGNDQQQQLSRKQRLQLLKSYNKQKLKQQQQPE